MTIPLSVWLLLLCSIATMRTSVSAERDLKILSLYQLPSLSIRFISTNSETAQSDNRLLVSDEVKEVTESYLEEYIQASLSQVSQYEDLTLQTVDLEGSLRSQYLGDGRVGYSGDFFGTLGVTDIPQRPPAAEMEPVLDTFVKRAFAPSAFASFRDKLERSDFLELQNVEDLTIKVDEPSEDFTPMVPIGKEDRPVGFVVMVVLFVLAVSVIVFLFAQRRARMIQYRAATQTPEYMYPDYDPESGEYPICTSFPEMNLQSNGDPEHNGTGGNTNYVPVVYDAARTYGADSVQRRYVATWNPLEMIYGASYMHSQEPYQRHTLERPRLKRKTSKDFVPMLQPESPTSTWRTWPSWFTTTAQNPLNQDHPFVYRDFPRHDGTPCLIYTPSSEDGLVPPAPSPRTSIVSKPAAVALRKSISIGTESSDGNDSTKEMAKDLYAQLTHEDKLDSFVDRLETLIKLKHRQFEERKEIERERLEIRRQLEVKRAHAIAHRAVLESPSHSRESSAVTPAIAAMAVGTVPLPPPPPPAQSPSLGLTATRKQFDQVMANSTAGSLMAQASQSKLIEEKAQLVEDELAAIEASVMGESSPGRSRHRKSGVLPFDETSTRYDPNFVIDDTLPTVTSPIEADVALAAASSKAVLGDPPGHSSRAAKVSSEPSAGENMKDEKKEADSVSHKEIV